MNIYGSELHLYFIKIKKLFFKYPKWNTSF